MFRAPYYPHRTARGFPRIRGDVPPAWVASPNRVKFSPHTRGCSHANVGGAPDWPVFPAYTGMFRCPLTQALPYGCFPRIRGDVPPKRYHEQPFLWFSPHTRGCSVAGAIASISSTVFPAYAGMFLKLTFLKWIHSSFPRIRGDVPQRHASGIPECLFSPHTRGCSVASVVVPAPPCVFPTYAGMFRKLSMS